MPPRKSARLNPDPDREADDASVHNSQPSTTTTKKSSTTRPTKRARKRARKQQKEQALPTVDDYKKIKGKRGYLKLMTEMPVDILLEIFSKVEPIDLLQLSRATKALRDIITNPNAAFLWKRVYENIPRNQRPPICPSDLSPMLYTDLLYGCHCHFCASSQGKLVHWPGRVRSCYRCARKQFLRVHHQGQIFALCSPWSFEFGHKTILGSYYYVLKAEYDRETRKWAELQNEEAKVKYKRSTQEKYYRTRSHSSRCSEFQERHKERKMELTSTTRDKRHADIILKIKQEGYGDELARFSSRPGGIDFLPGVRRAMALTDKSWQRIRTGILGFLEDQRQEARRYVIIRGYRDRIQRVVAAIEKVIKTIPQPRLTPPYGYFVRSQEFSSIIRDDTLETNTFDMRLQDLMSLVPDMITSWVTVSTGKLLELLDSNGETNLPLELACTFFKCRWCNDPITYPRILMHSCLRDKPRKPVGDEKDETEAARDENEDEEDEEDDEEETDELSGDVDNLQTQLDRLQNTPDRVWSQLLSWYDAADWNEDNDQVFADDEATGFAKAIVTVCGEDPAVASISRMENIDSRLECLRCCRLYKSKPPKRLIMNWKMAILHDIDTHYQDSPSETGWKLLTDEVELAQVKEAESKLRKAKAFKRACRHCDQHISQDRIVFHMQCHPTIKWEKGKQEEFIRDQEYYVALDTPLAKIPPFAVSL